MSERDSLTNGVVLVAFDAYFLAQAIVQNDFTNEEENKTMNVGRREVEQRRWPAKVVVGKKE